MATSRNVRQFKSLQGKEKTTTSPHSSTLDATPGQALPSLDAHGSGISPRIQPAFSVSSAACQKGTREDGSDLTEIQVSSEYHDPLLDSHAVLPERLKATPSPSTPRTSINKRKKFDSEEPEESIPGAEDLADQTVDLEGGVSVDAAPTADAEEEEDDDDGAPEVVSGKIAAQQTLGLPNPFSRFDRRKKRKTVKDLPARGSPLVAGSQLNIEDSQVATDGAIENASLGNSVSIPDAEALEGPEPGRSPDHDIVSQDAESKIGLAAPPSIDRLDLPKTITTNIIPGKAAQESIAEEPQIKERQVTVDTALSTSNATTEKNQGGGRGDGDPGAQSSRPIVRTAVQHNTTSKSSLSLSLSSSSTTTIPSTAHRHTRPRPSSSSLHEEISKPPRPTYLQKYRQSILNRHPRTHSWGPPGHRRTKFVDT